MSQIALQSRAKYTISIVSGPNKGDEYQLLSQSITIGRSDENDIILDKDKKASRNHAQIDISSMGITVKNLSENNKLRVDGKTVSRSDLRNNSVIIVGSSKIKFTVELLMSTAPVNNNFSLAQHNPDSHFESISQEQQHVHAVEEKKKSNLIFVSIIAIVVISAAFVFSQGTKTFNPLEIQSTDDIEANIETANDLRSEEAKIFKQKGLNTKEFQDAQSNYIKGFRDFKKGQYERAISSFHACLSLYPKHQLCQRYQKLSYKKHDELIQYNMMLGKKYFDQGQYQACRATFRNAMIMINDRNGKIYKEALANFKLCALKTEGQY